MGKNRSKFQEGWLLCQDFAGWLQKYLKDDHYAFCTVCKKKFDISNAGVCSVRIHMKGKQHEKNINATKITPRLNLSSVSSNTCKDISSLQNDVFAETSLNNESISVIDSCASTSNDVHSNFPQEINIEKPQNSTVQENPDWKKKFVIKEDVIKAEMIWAALKVVLPGSARSYARLSEFFPIMFKDSEIARNFQMKKDKLSYYVSYGLGPYFQHVLKDKLNTIPIFSVSFDESLNKVAQKGQMDFFVRFWNDEKNEVSTRYLTSAFLGHASAPDIFFSFRDTLEKTGIGLQRLFQIGMDGPNVNLRFFDDLRLYMDEENKDSPAILETGTCSLHVVNGAYKTGHKSAGWKVHDFLRNTYYLFKDFPSRRADYTEASKSNEFPQKFCSIRWVENSLVLQRALRVIPNLKKYLEFVKKDPPKSSVYEKVVVHMNNPALECQIGFLLTIADDLEPFLRKYQTKKPMLPYLAQDVFILLKDVMKRFLKSEVVDSLSQMKLLQLDIKKFENQLPLEKIDIGFTAGKSIRKMKDGDKLRFRKDCLNYLIGFTQKLFDRSPLKYSVVRNASSLTPEVMADDKEKAVSKFKYLLNVLVEKKRLSTVTADRLIKEYKELINNEEVQKVLSSYKEKDEDEKDEKRLDHLWGKIFSAKKCTDNLKNTVKQILTMFHGQGDVERGFSVNKELLIENLSETSLISQRSVYDSLLEIGGVDHWEITTKAIQYVKNASARRREAVEANKKAEKKEKEDRKRVSEEIVKIETKKKKLMESAKAQCVELEEEKKKLEKILKK